MKTGDLVEQNHKGKNRQGVIYKSRKDPDSSAIVPWTYYEVLWATGERSIERADHITPASDLMNQFNDLVVLRELQDSITAGASYD
tara:strand:+ start:403 stop:660 length:258 start_codon:yes stop_codon:yes gene_type:complete